MRLEDYRKKDIQEWMGVEERWDGGGQKPKKMRVFSFAETFAGAAFQGLKQCPGAEAVKDWYPNQQHWASRNLLGKQGTYPRLNWTKKSQARALKFVFNKLPNDSDIG